MLSDIAQQACPFSAPGVDANHGAGPPVSTVASPGGTGRAPGASSESKSQDQLDGVLPASYRNKNQEISTPTADDTDWLNDELDLQRLTAARHRLWAAGRPMPPRPLHHQLLLSRDIFITERMDMHLVWTTGRIFLKPLPRFLLEPRFWQGHLCCRKDCCCTAKPIATQLDVLRWDQVDQVCEQKRFRNCAVGFLFSYTALIARESDFYIAKEKHLIPNDLTWQGWRTVSKSFLKRTDVYTESDGRFLYGELRLSRLNKIFLLRWPPSFRGYMSHWTQYKTFFGDNLAWVVSATVYLGIVLTAMQVGLGVDVLVNNDAFQAASYGFTVFSIIGPLGLGVIITLLFLVIFADNWVSTANFEKRTFRRIRETRKAKP